MPNWTGLATGPSYLASAAGLDRAGFHAGAGLVLGDPTGVDDVAEVVLGDRIRRDQDRGHAHALLAFVEHRDAGQVGGLLAVGHGDGHFRRLLAEDAAVLPDRNGLRAERDAVQSGKVAVLTRYRHLAVEALRLERGNRARGHAVVLGNHSVDLIVLLGQALFHFLLGVVGLPAVGEGLADILDLARVHRWLQHFVDAAEQEGRVRVALVALDEGVVAGRLRLEDFLGHQAADADVVEGDVKRVRILELDVVGDQFDAGVGGFLDRGQDRIGVEGDDEDDVDLLRDQPFDIRRLLGGRALRVGGDIGVARRLDDLFDRRIVGLPALFLEGLPGR